MHTYMPYCTIPYHTIPYRNIHTHTHYIYIYTHIYIHCRGSACRWNAVSGHGAHFK